MNPSSRKLRDASGCLHPHHEIADSSRLWARSVLSIHQHCGVSQALCTPMMKIADSLRLCAPPSRKLGDVSGFVHPHMKMADSLRLRAFFCAHHSRTLRGVSGCLHPHHKVADSLRLWAFSVLRSHQNWGMSQALCTPIMKIADRLRLCASPPSPKVGHV